jgi:SAM-dependent methyltransferase
MTTIAWNRSHWNDSARWPGDGEGWSETWGGSRAQWIGTIWPRVHRFLPARSVLEVAPGLGRWTRFLLPACERYVGVDLSDLCVQGCKERFGDVAHASFVRNDGRSLAKVPDRSVDFVFSFDSLVHVELDVIHAYVQQIVRKLTPSGAAFLHHSNALAAGPAEAAKHARAADVSAELVREVVERSGGRVLVQEELNWGGTALTDAFTLFSTEAAFAGHHPVLVKNPSFMLEAELVRKNLSPYSAIGIPVAEEPGPGGAGDPRRPG